MEDNIKVLKHGVVVEVKCYPQGQNNAFLPVTTHTELMWAGEFDNFELALEKIREISTFVKEKVDVKSEQ